MAPVLKCIMALGLATAVRAKTFVFKADKCNTNFNQASNWRNTEHELVIPSEGSSSPTDPSGSGRRARRDWVQNDDGGLVSSPVAGATTDGPQEVYFADDGENFYSVDAYVPGGEYDFGAQIVFEDDVVISLDEDGVMITFSEDNLGPSAKFVAGQTTWRQECSMGCQHNFYEWSGRTSSAVQDSVEVELWRLEEEPNFYGSKLKNATRVPCGMDTVAIPVGYGVSMFQTGFGAVKQMAMKENGKAVAIDKVEDMPAFMLFPVVDMNFHLGTTVVEQCENEGFVDDEGACVCTTECPVSDNDHLYDVNMLEISADRFANEFIVDMNRDVDVPFDFEFAHAFTERSGVTQQCAKQINKGIVAHIVDLVFEYTMEQMAITVDTLKIDIAEQSIRIAGNARGKGNILYEQLAKPKLPITMDGEPLGVSSGSGSSGSDSGSGSGSGSATLGEIDIRGERSSVLAMTLYHASIASIAKQNKCRINDFKSLLQVAGVYQATRETELLFVGYNLPQIVVNRLVDDNNKEGAVTAVFDALQDAYGMRDVNKQAMLDSWRLVKPQTRQELTLGGNSIDPSRRNARDRRDVEHPLRGGLATETIMVELVYTRWNDESGFDRKMLEQFINSILAKFDVQSHHKCFSIAEGFDDACVNDLVASAIATQLDRCAQDDPTKASECRQAARDSAYNIILDIKGCGLYGKTEEFDGSEGCADAATRSRIQAAANAQVDDTVALAIKKIEDDYAQKLLDDYNAEVLVNETKAELARLRADKLRGDIRDAEAEAFNKILNTPDSVPTFVIAAGRKLQEATNEKVSSQTISETCDLQFPRDPRSLEDPCALERGTFEQAEDLVAIRSAVLDVYKRAEANQKTGGDAALDAKADALEDQVEEIKVEVELNQKDVNVAEAEVELAEEEMANFGCVDPDTVAPGTEIRNAAECPALLNALQKAQLKKFKMQNILNEKLAELQEKEAELEAALLAAENARSTTTTTTTTGSPDAASDEASDDDDKTMLYVVAICAVIVLCLIVVVAIMATKKPAAYKEPDVNSQVAFNNPMYDEPGAAPKQNPAFDEVAPPAGDLYDEPAFQPAEPAEQPDTDGGYLDVQEDASSHDDSDDDDDSSDDDSSDDE